MKDCSTRNRRPKPQIKGFVFVGNPIDIRCRLPFEISDRLKFKRANKTQRSKIRDYLQGLGGHCDNCGPFERTYTETREEVEDDPLDIPIFSYDSSTLPEQDWRYYVVEFRDCAFSLEHGFLEINDLRAVSKLTSFPLRLNPVLAFTAWRSDFTSDWEYFHGIAGTGGNVVEFQLHHLEELRQCYKTFITLRHAHPDIVRSIEMYHDIPDYHGYNGLTALGLFSVLESVLTHSPRGEYDSVGQQIRKKIALLQRRLPEQPDYSCFDSAKHDTVWTKLYDYRCRLAHGGKICFKGKLSLLKDPFTPDFPGNR